MGARGGEGKAALELQAFTPNSGGLSGRVAMLKAVGALVAPTLSAASEIERGEPGADAF